MPSARLKIFAAASRGAVMLGAIRSGGLLMFQIVQIRLAKTATDRIEVEADIAGFIFAQDAQQIAPQLLARDSSTDCAAKCPPTNVGPHRARQ